MPIVAGCSPPKDSFYQIGRQQRQPKRVRYEGPVEL